MELNYINIIANNSVWVINRISNLLRKRNYNIEAFWAAFDNDWFWHIIVWIRLKDWVNISQVIEQINKLFDVKEVSDLWDCENRIEFIESNLLEGICETGLQTNYIIVANLPYLTTTQWKHLHPT